MIILRPNLDTQSVTIIPRYDVENITLTIRRKETDETSTFNLSTTYANGYMSFEFEYNVLEAEQFDLEVKDGSTVLFRDKAFATDETDLENYKINSDIITY